MSALIGLPELRIAQAAIQGRLHRTPIFHSRSLSKYFGFELYLKAENLQKTGSFKVRGALNKLRAMRSEAKARGVISISAGNHAQALAWAGADAGIRSTIVMPATSVRSKILATESYGGEVILTEEDLMDTCLTIQQERDLAFVHPFDDRLIIAGQGTVGQEVLTDLPQVDVVIAGVGGGGMISGVGAAMKHHESRPLVWGVEPEGADAMSQSLAAGHPIKLDQLSTVADGLAAPFAGTHTLQHVQGYVDQMVTVADHDIVEAMVMLMERCKLVVEPAGAASLAAILAGRLHPPKGSSTVCVLSGGNVDRERLKSLL